MKSKSLFMPCSRIVSLGLDENDSKKTTLEVYRQYFERPFVHATEVYYKMESEKFLSENSVTEYMKKVMMSLPVAFIHGRSQALA